MQQDVIGKSALIALAGFMASVVIVTAGAFVAWPGVVEMPRVQPRAVAAVDLPAAMPSASPGSGTDAARDRAAGSGGSLRPARGAIPSLGAVAPGIVAREDGGIEDAAEPWPVLLPGVAAREVPGRTLAPPPATRPAGDDRPASKPEETKLAALAPVATGRAEPPPPPPDAELSGVPPWRRFAALPPADDGKPLIVIIIDDLGLNAARARRVLALPRTMTLAFLPYGDDALRLARLARRAGHELLLHLPMEPHGREEDPGPNALLVDLAPSEALRRIKWNLDRLDGYVGVNNHMGSRFTERSDKLDPLMRRLKSRGLLFVDSVTSGKTVAGKTARRFGVPTAARDVFIDHVIERRSIEAQLRRVERVARGRGLAIALGHPHRETLRALEAWLPTLRGKGFSLAPVSAVVARRRTG